MGTPASIDPLAPLDARLETEVAVEADGVVVPASLVPVPFVKDDEDADVPRTLDDVPFVVSPLTVDDVPLADRLPPDAADALASAGDDADAPPPHAHPANATTATATEASRFAALTGSTPATSRSSRWPP
jgi:hypothetical protein